MAISTLETLKKRVQMLNQIDIEHLDYGPVENGELVRKDELNDLNRTLRKVISRLRQGQKYALKVGKDLELKDSIDTISMGQPDKFRRLTSKHPEVLIMLLANDDLTDNFARLITSVKSSANNDKQASQAISTVFAKLTDDLVNTQNRADQTTPNNE